MCIADKPYVYPPVVDALRCLSSHAPLYMSYTPLPPGNSKPRGVPKSARYHWRLKGPGRRPKGVQGMEFQQSSYQQGLQRNLDQSTISAASQSQHSASSQTQQQQRAVIIHQTIQMLQDGAAQLFTMGSRGARVLLGMDKRGKQAKSIRAAQPKEVASDYSNKLIVIDELAVGMGSPVYSIKGARYAQSSCGTIFFYL